MVAEFGIRLLQAEPAQAVHELAAAEERQHGQEQRIRREDGALQQALQASAVGPPEDAVVLDVQRAQRLPDVRPRNAHGVLVKHGDVRIERVLVNVKQLLTVGDAGLQVGDVVEEVKGLRAASAKRISDPQPLPGQQTFGVEVAEKTRKREVLRTQVSEGTLPHGVEAEAALLEVVLLLLPAHVSFSQREAERTRLDLAKASRERTVGLLHQVAVGHAPVELVDRASSRVVTVDVIVAESLLASGVRELRAYLAGAKLSQPEQPLSLARASLDGVALVPQEIDGVVGHGVVAPDGVQIRTAGEKGLRKRIKDAPGALAA